MLNVKLVISNFSKKKMDHFFYFLEEFLLLEHELQRFFMFFSEAFIQFLFNS
jgi:hypothetical protein